MTIVTPPYGRELSKAFVFDITEFILFVQNICKLMNVWQNGIKHSLVYYSVITAGAINYQYMNFTWILYIYTRVLKQNMNEKCHGYNLCLILQ